MVLYDEVIATIHEAIIGFGLFAIRHKILEHPGMSGLVVLTYLEHSRFEINYSIGNSKTNGNVYVWLSMCQNNRFFK